MKKNEVKKAEAISIMHDDVASDELRFQMLRDIFQGYEQALTQECIKPQEKKKLVGMEVYCRG